MVSQGLISVLLDDCDAAREEPSQADLDQVLAMAARILDAESRLDVLVNNVAIGFGTDHVRREVSRQGDELRFAVNYLAPYLLTANCCRCSLTPRAGGQRRLNRAGTHRLRRRHAGARLRRH